MRQVGQYREIANVLRVGIQDGVYPRGSILPSERGLAHSFRVSRDLIRDAVRVLAVEGLVRWEEISGHWRTRVTPNQDHDAVPLPSGATVQARMPTPEERRELGIGDDPGIPVIVVSVPGGEDLIYAGNSITIRAVDANR